MIKGKTIIELTDVHTGEVERHEDDNMVTNALNKIFEPIGHLKDYEILLKTYVPYYEKLLGGILLFDNAIEENVDNIYAPANAGLVGCGVYNLQNGSSGTARGNFNVTESEVDYKNKYVKYVYDFSTSQGNGTIACVCLTSKPGGFTSYGSKDTSTSSDSNSDPFLLISSRIPVYVESAGTGGITLDKTSLFRLNSEFIFAIDPMKDLVFYFKFNSEKSISIVSRKAYLKSVSLFENPITQKPLVDSITLTDLENGLIGTSFVSYNYNDEEKALYIISFGNSTLPASGKIEIIKIEYDSWNISEYQLLNETGDQLDTRNNYVFGYYGFLYIASYREPYNLYKINMQDSSDVTVLDKYADSVKYFGSPVLAAAGRIFYNYPNSSKGYGRVNIVNTERNCVDLAESYGLMGTNTNIFTYTPFIDQKNTYYASNVSGSVYFFGPYLATINNLSSPVVKTADKTMKITYIIQEVAE